MGVSVLGAPSTEGTQRGTKKGGNLTKKPNPPQSQHLATSEGPRVSSKHPVSPAQQQPETLQAAWVHAAGTRPARPPLPPLLTC